MNHVTFAGLVPALDFEFSHPGPVLTGHHEVHDPRRLDQCRPHRRQTRREVVGFHVGLRRVVLEGLDQDEFVGVLDAAGPLEPEVARFVDGWPW